jgi:hypothetical protein
MALVELDFSGTPLAATQSWPLDTISAARASVFSLCESLLLTLRVNEQFLPDLSGDCSGAAITGSLETFSTEGLNHNDGCNKSQ